MGGGRWWRWAVLGLWAVLLVLPMAGMLGNTESLAGAAAGEGVDWATLWRLGMNTVWVCALAAGGATLWALLPALVAARWEGGFRRGIMVAAMAAPLFVAPSVVALASVHLLGGQGWLTRPAALVLPLEREGGLRFAPIYTLWGGAFAMGWAWLPLVFLVLYSLFRRCGRSMEEAALLDAGPVSVLLRVVAPSLGVGLLLGGAVLFLLGATDLGIPESLRSLPLMAREVYVQFGVYYDTRAALWSGVAGVVLALGVLGAVAALARRVGLAGLAESESDGEEGGVPATGAGAPRGMAAGGFRLLAWALALVPVSALFSVLLVTLRGPEGWLPVLELTWRLTAREFWFSLRLAAAGAALCVACGVVVGLALAGLRRPLAWRAVVLAGFVLPGPVFGFGIKMALLWPPGSLPFGADDWLAALDATVAPLLFIYTIQFAPLVAVLVEAQLRRAPREWRESVALESSGPLAGARVWGLWWIWPAAVMGGLGCFALSLGEIGATVLVVPPGTTTLSVRLFTLMHYAPVAQVSALCLLMALPALAVVPVMFWLFGRRGADKPVPSRLR